MAENTPPNRLVLIAFGLLSLLMAGGVLLLLSLRPQAVSMTIIPPQATVTPAPTATASPVLVYVTGSVANPEQTYSLPYGSRVQDAISAAGGSLPDADLSGVNLAQRLYDGALIFVPSKLAEAQATPTNIGGIVYINSASKEELMSLPNIGDKTADAILAYRDERGRINSLEELDAIEGIGASTLERLAPLIRFD
jgi:competence protein ComEA